MIELLRVIQLTFICIRCQMQANQQYANYLIKSRHAELLNGKKYA